MKEDLISFLWKFQYFNKMALATTRCEELFIISVGQENHNTGPDFFNAQISIDNQKWAGNVEIHVKASDWFAHGHEQDVNYENIILHVVWENDMPVFRHDNTIIPTLELKNRITPSVLVNYQRLIGAKKKWINCEKSIGSIDDFTLDNWLERLYIERLEDKSVLITKLLEQSNNDWENVLFKLLLRSFGLKVNGDSFLAISNTIDFSIIRKEQDNLNAMEALLFGMAGLLNTSTEGTYVTYLKEEFTYLKAKYTLVPMVTSVQFFRLRPNNFPTIRLSQLANLYHQQKSLFSKLISFENLEDIYDLFDIAASEFWDTHYTFETISKCRKKRLSKSFMNLLLINTIIPLKFMYQHHIGTPNNELILDLMNEICSEKNGIITEFLKLNIQSDSAAKSQGLLQLKNGYCDKQRCLRCVIGKNLLMNES